MKILYIGDNRNRTNWGCRATSMALGALLREAGEISGIVSGKEVAFDNSSLAWGGMRPASFWKKLDALPFGKVQRGFKAVKRRLAIREDYIGLSPAASLARFHTLRKDYGFLQEIYRKTEEADALVINGEGTYIFTSPPRRDTLFFNFMLHLGQQMGKRTYVLNAMFSDCPKSGRNGETFGITMEMLRKCDAVSVRDPQSLEVLREGGIEANARFHPDALFTWSDHLPEWKRSIVGELSRLQPFGEESHELLPGLDFDRPYICLSGSSSAAWRQEEARVAYTRLARSLLGLGHQLLITPTCDGDSFLALVAQELGLPLLPLRTPIRLCAGVVGKAEAFVSGRFHPAILASDGGTPCVFMGSNSHKTLSLQRMLDYEDPFEFQAIPDDREIREITDRTAAAIAANLRPRIAGTVARRAAEARFVTSLFAS